MPSSYRLRRRAKDGLKKATAHIAYALLISVYRTAKAASHAKRATVSYFYMNRKRRNLRRQHIPKPKRSRKSPGKSPTPAAASLPPFLRLPVEIRQRIYELALPPGVAAGAIFQPNVSLRGPMSAYVSGGRPDHWRPDQRVRSDDDPPSSQLALILGLGGSHLAQQRGPPARGCVRYGYRLQLICGDKVYSTNWWAMQLNEPITKPVDLLCVCRTIYSDLFEQLYGGMIVSFFGAEMVRFFVRNASPKGLSLIRYVHIAICLPMDDQSPTQASMKAAEAAMLLIREEFSLLCQLDVEVVLTWGEPRDSLSVWRWLMGEKMLGQLRGRGLDVFVLKASALAYTLPPESRNGFEGWTPEIHGLAAWEDREYEQLKAEILRKEGSCQADGYV